ncbi:MAG: DUF4907 domain-containing protein [Ginsengibacter sp.]
MTKKIFIPAAILFIALFFVGFSIKSNKKNKDKMLEVESVAIQTSAGWGYNILVDHKIYIHQEFIPAIEGKKSFANKEDAIKTSEVAIKKLVKGTPPFITKKELDSLNISLQ